MSTQILSPAKPPVIRHRWQIGLIVLATLVAQNCGVYWNHYFGTDSFPWDFIQTYHALPYYWTTLIKSGVFPQWVPFQGMGYPLALNIQSYLFYLPYYVFVVLPLAYTLKAAIWFQGLHILAGAVGFYLLARRNDVGWRHALLGAFAFQLFGGFFSNSQHSDIVRAYALTPWLFAALGTVRAGVRMPDPFAFLALPLTVCLLLTGGYPGTAIATLFMLGVFVLSERACRRTSWRSALVLAGLGLLGVLMAAVALLPPLAMSAEIARAHNAAGQARMVMSPKHLFTLFQPFYFDALPEDISMRSFHIGLPMVVCLFFVPWSVVKKQLPWAVVIVLACLLASGGWLYRIFIALLPPLGLSRFPIGDYKHLIAIGLILFAVMGLERGLAYSRANRTGLRITAFWTGFVLSIWVLGFKEADASKFWLGLAIALAVLAVVALGSVPRMRAFLVPCLMGLLVLDVARVQLGIPPNYHNQWIDWNGLSEHRAVHGDLAQIDPQLLQRIRGITCRPARNDEPHSRRNRGFTGYFTGQYMVEDYSGPMQFVRQQRIMATPALKRFAIQPWRAVAVDGDLDASFLQRIDQPAAADGVACAQYRINDQTLAVDLDKPQTIVENELYHRGWHGRLLDQSGRQITGIEPTEVQGFRAWNLPAGHYRLREEFRTPLLLPALAITLAGALAWLVLNFWSVAARWPGRLGAEARGLEPHG